MNTPDQTPTVPCPNCDNGIRTTTPVTIQCGTCMGTGTLTEARLAHSLAHRVPDPERDGTPG